MKANGFGRLSNDAWTMIPPTRQHHWKFKNLLDITNQKNVNPYQILEEPTLTTFNKLDLPNGESIYTTFSSLQDLVTYVSKLPRHIQHIQHNLTSNMEEKSTNSSLLNKNADQKSLHRSKTNGSHKTTEINTSNPQIPDSDIKLENIDCNAFVTTMLSRTITTAIANIFGEIDLAHVHNDVAKSMCKKVTALMFLSMPEWIDVNSMDSSTLRKTLQTFKHKNQANTDRIEKEGEDDPQDMSYEEAMILNDNFDIKHLYYANIDTLKQMACEVVKHYSFKFDLKTIEPMSRTELICQLYEFLYLVQQYLRLNVPRSRRSGSSWTSGLLRQIYRWGHAQWLDRNDVVHKKESAYAEVKLM